MNRLKESIEIFSQIQLQIWLNNKTFILFLNKKDIFEDKIKKSHLIDHFEDFKGKMSILERVKKETFITWLGGQVSGWVPINHFDTKDLNINFKIIQLHVFFTPK